MDIYFEFVHENEVFFTRLCVCARCRRRRSPPFVRALCLLFVCTRLAVPTFGVFPRSERAGWFVYTELFYDEFENGTVKFACNLMVRRPSQTKRKRGQTLTMSISNYWRCNSLYGLPKRECEIFRRKSCFVGFFCALAT